MAFAPIFQRPFSATFDRRAAAAGNGLLNNLIAYWPMNEASGDALDAHTNGLTMALSSGGNYPSAVGKISTARARAAGNLSRADDAYLSTGDIDFTIAAWLYLTYAGNSTIISKWSGGSSQREYLLYYNHNDHAPNQRMTFAVSSGGASFAHVDATDFGAISLSTWYLVIGWHDAVNNQIGVSVNNISTVAAHNAGVYNGTAAVYLGILDGGAYGLVGGALDEISFWKSAAGGGGVLSAAQRTALYNGGAGLAYAQFTT